jgi:hypothetical protein
VEEEGEGRGRRGLGRRRGLGLQPTWMTKDVRVDL